MTSAEVLERRLARAQARIDVLESMVEHQTRELFLSNQQLLESNAFMTEVLRSMAGGLIVVDDARHITLVNRRLVALVGRSESDLVGVPVSQVLPAVGTYRPDVTEAAHEEEAELTTVGGPIPIALTHSAIDDGNGHIYVVIDARERKAAEAALRLAQEKLIATSRRAGMADVATGVIHNVGNVITSVKVALQQLKAAGAGSRLASLHKVVDLLGSTTDLPALFGSPKGQKLTVFLGSVTQELDVEALHRAQELDRVLRHLDHVVQVIASQQQHARTTLVVQTLDAADLFRRALAMEQDRIAKLGVQVIEEIQPGLSVRSDRHLLLQILVNLVDNALDAMEPVEGSRTLRLAAKLDGDVVRFGIRDSGVGVAAEHRTRIFEHGFTTRPDGHGFGLHVSANGATKLGGSLRCASKGPGHGAEFVLTVPREAPEEEES